MKLVAGFGAALAGFGIWYALFQGQSRLLRFGRSEEAFSTSWWIVFSAGYLVLVIGSFLGVVCRHLIERRRRGQSLVDIGKVLKQSMRQIELWVSFLASPLIYGWILTVGADLAFGPYLYFALQTGFSSYVVVNSLLGTPPVIDRTAADPASGDGVDGSSREPGGSPI